MSGRIRNVTPKPGFVWDGRSVVPARVGDGLANILTGRGTSVDRQTYGFWNFVQMLPEQIVAAYRSNWLHRKIVDIPAQDMTRAGRDWDATDDEIQTIEAEEKRLGYWRKIHSALWLGRLGGGAILIGMKDRRPDLELPKIVNVGDLEYLAVLSRWQLSSGPMVLDPASPNVLQPSYFQLSGAGQPVRIHPSRVVVFPGLPVPMMGHTMQDDAYWGDSVIQAVDEAVKQATQASAGFASLIDEAKIDVYRFSQLVQQLSQPGGDAKVMQRVELTNTGKSIHRAVVLDAEDEWEQRQLAWAGIRDVIITYDARVAGAADIPATRLFGKAPDGQNSTGESDLINYYQGITSRQEADLRPQIERLDAVVLASAGVKSTDLTWKFSPVRELTKQQEAEIENKEADSAVKYANSGLIPESALAKATQNRMIESGRWPGLQDAIDEAEAAGEALPEDDPSEIVPVAPPGQRQADRRFADATPRTLYVSRKVVNVSDLASWARSQGLPDLQDDLHVTITYSRQALDWMKVEPDWNEEKDGELTIAPGGVRIVEPLGDRTAVLLFTSSRLSWRHEQIIRAGASHDYADYQPHISLTGDLVDLSSVEPYRGRIVLGPEIFEEVRSGDA